MKVRDLLRDVVYEMVQHGDYDSVTFITNDSKKVAHGALYVCIRGLRQDGHRFIAEVAAAGAAAVLIDEEQDSYPPGLTVIKVENSRKALCLVAAAFHGNPSECFRLVGVTGTNGKTSITYFMETILNEAGRRVGLVGTMGAHVGCDEIDIIYQTPTTPDTLELQAIFAAMRDLNADDVVMEVSSHALALHKVEGLKYEVGIFTNLTQDHLEFHGTMANYLEAKSKLFGQSKYGVVNADDPASAKIMAKHSCHFTTYGIENECDLRAVHIEQTTDGSFFDVEVNGETVRFHLPVKGKFNIYNCLGVIGAALALGVPLEAIKRGVAAIRGIPGRIQSITNGKGIHVLVDYAHTPDGLVNVINAVREFTKGKVVTVFGCGGDKDRTKRSVMGRIAGELSDYCIITSDNPRSEPPEAIIGEIEAGLIETNCPYEAITDRREAIFRGMALLEAEDSIIIAGKGHEHYQIIGNESIPFDDVSVATEALDSI